MSEPCLFRIINIRILLKHTLQFSQTSNRISCFNEILCYTKCHVTFCAAPNDLLLSSIVIFSPVGHRYELYFSYFNPSNLLQ